MSRPSCLHCFQLPIATFQSGPVNSLRGAAALSGLREGIVLDIGGTTTDVGALAHGLPRPAPAAALIAGVRTSLAAPDLASIGAGAFPLCMLPSRTPCKRCSCYEPPIHRFAPVPT